jgi:hypothetical protein
MKSSAVPPPSKTSFEGQKSLFRHPAGTGNCPGAISIDSTAIFIAVADSTLGRRWFTAFYVYVQHDFITSVIASFSTTPAHLLRQPRTASALSAVVHLATVMEAFSASLLSDMA